MSPAEPDKFGEPEPRIDKHRVQAGAKEARSAKLKVTVVSVHEVARRRQRLRPASARQNVLRRRQPSASKGLDQAAIAGDDSPSVRRQRQRQGRRAWPAEIAVCGNIKDDKVVPDADAVHIGAENDRVGHLRSAAGARANAGRRDAYGL
jgi:hypothetical protein